MTPPDYLTFVVPRNTVYAGWRHSRGQYVVSIGEAAGEETAIKAAISDLKRQLAVIPMSSEASLDMLSD